MHYTIEKFKVKDGFPTVLYTQSDEEKELSSKHEASFNQIVHHDLSAAMDRLTIHMCLLAEQVSEFGLVSELGHLSYALQGEKIYAHNELSSFRCTGFTLSSGGVVLIGRKNLKTKKVFNVIAPFCLLNEDSDYDYVGFLNSAIQEVLAEVELMLGENKFGGAQQPEAVQLELWSQEHIAAV